MSVFISYRRGVSKHLARLIYSELRVRHYDVFLDVSAIDSGAFDRIILEQISAREHFLLVLSPGSLERCNDPNDWLRLEIEAAIRLNRNIVPVFDEGFDIDREKNSLPSALRDAISRLNAPPYSHYYFDAFIETICSRFLKPPQYNVKTESTSETQMLQKHQESSTQTPALQPTAGTSQNLIAAQLSWIEIPRGNVTVQSGGYLETATTFNVPAFSISKYPVTNALFALFVEAGGYAQDEWWTEIALDLKAKEGWSAPRYWKDSQWNKPEYPVVAITWFEAMAFCLWLRNTLGEHVMLPTEQQWQRAAQGEVDNTYPWGDKLDKGRCNYGGSGTSPVHQYDGVGDSPFGVSDMSGNVWEWCLTGFDTGLQDYDTSSKHRVLRGGSWISRKEAHLRTNYRFGNPPAFWNFDRGFRLARNKV